MKMAGQWIPHFHTVTGLRSLTNLSIKNTGAHQLSDFRNEFLWQTADHNSWCRMKTVSIIALLRAGMDSSSSTEKLPTIHFFKRTVCSSHVSNSNRLRRCKKDYSKLICRWLLSLKARKEIASVDLLQSGWRAGLMQPRCGTGGDKSDRLYFCLPISCRDNDLYPQSPSCSSSLISPVTVLLSCSLAALDRPALVLTQALHI